MSEIVLLIPPKTILERTTMHTNTDEKMIFPEIKAAQDMFIRPLLGSVLFDKIKTDIAADSLTGEYKKIMDEFLIDAICNYVMANMPEALNFQVHNTGVKTKTSENSETPSMSDLYVLIAKHKKRAEHYANACRLYILAHLPSFPEYHAAGGVDKVSPDRGSYSCPFYLGNRGDEYTGPNRNPNYNSNDPYTD